MLNRYFCKQITEIKNDMVLRVYGAVICAMYVLCYIKWKPKWVIESVALAEKAHCWPFFENCFAFRPFTVEQMHMIVGFYGLASLIGVLLFLFSRVSLGYYWLLALTVLKTWIYFQDYSLRMNQHYMLGFVTVVFLFLPYKRRLLRIAIVMFYFWAATLKFNMEWFSGQALTIKPMGIPWRLLPAACVYAVILESVIVWGLISSNRRIFWAAFLQFALFHIVSWNVVGYFYPILMFMMLTIFPLSVFRPDPKEPKSLLRSLFTGREPASVYAYILFFSVCQIIPMLIRGDEKVTGEGRILALHMIDAHVRCEGTMTLKFKDGTKKEFPVPDFYINRTQCEPALNFTKAKRECYLHRNDPMFDDIDLYYEARRSDQKILRPLVDVKDFCGQDLTYKLFSTNSWIKHNE